MGCLNKFCKNKHKTNFYKNLHNNGIKSLEKFISNEQNLLTKIKNIYILKDILDNIKKNKLLKIIS